MAQPLISDISSVSSVTQADAAATASVTAQNIPQSPVVLLIDDQPIVAESIRRLLLGEPDIQFHYCSDPQQAIPFAIKVSPTVILQDLVMPDTDGLMLVKFFRNTPATKDIPVIVLSNRDEAMVKAESFSQGANDYLVKLPDPVELIARVRYHSTAYCNLLKRHEADLTLAYNKELERRVEARTAELKHALENLKQTQSKLIHNEKMSSLGQLVAGIAHEINNPVNFIHGNVEYVERYVTGLYEVLEIYEQNFDNSIAALLDKYAEIDFEFVRADLPKVIKSLKIGTERIQNLVSGLKAFSRFDEAEVKLVDIHQGINSTLMILGPKLKDINVTCEYDELSKIECLPGPLNQVFMNIIANAIDAVEHVDNPSILIRTKGLPHDLIQVTISDNGVGISKETQTKLFDAFFTTKSVGKGTGLGLSISHQIIVEKHGGNISFESEVGQGTTFTIEIPAHHSDSALDLSM
ncbi:MAG: response regulator [Leptolyngbya sp. SIOISBB]|nr:response regulator [Leptolyngbya sp. SIOISBB]